MRTRLTVAVHVLRLTLRADRRTTAVIAIMICLQSASAALIAVSQRWLVQSADTTVATGIIGAAVVGALGHAAVAAGNRVQTTLRSELGERVDVLLNQEILTLTAKTPTLEHLERPDYLDRLSALRSGTEDLAAVCWSVFEAATSVISLALTVWLLITVHPALGLLALLGVPPLLLARRGLGRIRAARDACAPYVRAERRLHDLCIDPEPAKEVRIAGSGNVLSFAADDLWRVTARRETLARLAAASWQMAGWLCYLAGFGMAIIVTGRLITSGATVLGDIVLVTTLATRLRGQLSVTIAGISRVSSAGHVTRHFLWLHDFAARVPVGTGAPPRRLVGGFKLHNLGFGYPGSDRLVLRDISVSLPAGSVVGLVGVNGAGKSTLVKLLLGLYRPTSGRITVDGRALTDLDPAAYAEGLSAAFQDFVKLEVTAKESIGVGDLARMDDATVRAAAERAGASDVIEGLDQGLSTPLGLSVHGVQLSHGQWQKLAMARAMMRQAPVLLVLDEPTAALDPQAEQDVFDHFAEYARQAARESGSILVLVSHRFSTLHLADHIVVIHDGTVQEQGTHQELMASAGAYADLYRAQARAYS